MYKIFFLDRFILLSDDERKALFHIGECRVIRHESKQQLYALIDEFRDGTEQKLIIVHNDIEKLRNKFFSYFKPIDAAGGFVRNDKGKVLFIKRHGLWDLPKGKAEEQEKPEQTALREVEEECGLHNIIINGDMIKTYHTYKHKDDIILKTTYWYEMLHNGNETPVPQQEEDITDVLWLDEIDDLSGNYLDSYASIKEVINTFSNLR